MNKIIFLMIGALLYADGQDFLEVGDAPLLENITEPELVKDVVFQKVVFLAGNQLILDNGLVLELMERYYIELFDVGDDLLVKNFEGSYSVLHKLTNVEVTCKFVGELDGEVQLVRKVMDGIIELSNGDLYLTEDDMEGFWSARTSVLKVITQDVEMLLDLASGDSERVTCLGALDSLKILDTVVSCKGHHIEFSTVGGARWISSDLGSSAYWDISDEVIIKKFNRVTIASFDEQAPLLFVHNVTRDEFAIVIAQ